MKPYKHPDSLRRVAILVASLDDALAGQLLESLPADEANQVRDLVESLGEIDPEEQQAVLLQFQQSTPDTADAPSDSETSYRSSEAVELDIDASLERELERIEQYERELDTKRDKKVVVAEDKHEKISPEQRCQLIGDAAGNELAEQLHEEHPQVVALVLSRLTETQAAETLSHLPSATQSLVIQRLVYSCPAIDDAVEELEIQLAERLLQRRRQQEYFNSGSDLARRILENAPEEERRVLLDRIRKHDPKVASAIIEVPVPVEIAARNRLATAYGLQAADVEVESSAIPSATAGTTEFLETDQVTWESSAQVDQDEKAELDPALLESLEDSALQALLAVANEQVVQVYLSTASDQQFRRLTAGLPRKDAKRLRKSIRNRRISQESIDLAHQSLLNIAERAGLLNHKAVN